MAEYENPTIPEGINVSPTHPLKEFALLLAGISSLIVVSVLVLSLVAGYLVRFVSFAQEKALISGIETHWVNQRHVTSPEKQKYLQALAERLAKAMSLPADMSITVHHSADESVNAMATLGGHIVVFQGLIDALPNENALAMVLAHEISHVQRRHPIVAMGRGFTVALALSGLSGFGDGMMQQWLGSMGMLPILSFSRSQEAEADADALQALLKTYGHVEGAEALFTYLERQKNLPHPPQLLSTHPGHEERIERIRRFAQQRRAETIPALQPLPDYLKTAGKSDITGR